MLSLCAKQVAERDKFFAPACGHHSGVAAKIRYARRLRSTRPGALIPAENKQQVTLRLDADVLDFFKETGKRYQSRINAALREYMAAHR